MGVNQELNELQKQVTRKKILETAFRVFSEKTIGKVRMTDVAEAAGIGVATVYRYFPTKPVLVLSVSTWAWDQYLTGSKRRLDGMDCSAAEKYEYFLNSFLDLYRGHRDLLRFNQFFNVYIENENAVPAEAMQPYLDMIDVLSGRFEEIYRLGQEDGTLRTDLSSREIFAPTLHLMLAAVTRYAVGLVYEGGDDPEKELVLLKSLLMREFTKAPDQERDAPAENPA